MEEKQLLESWELEDRDWQGTPVAVKHLVVRLGKELEELKQQIEQLEAENQLLKEKVNRSSRNSHGAPSSDLVKPAHLPGKTEKVKKAGRATGTSRS